MKKTTTSIFAFLAFLILSFQSLAQDDVLILYNDSWGANGTFNCVQDYAGPNGNFTLCPIGTGSGLAAPACAINLCTYDIIMVQATYSDLNAAFIADLVTYLQCGGNLYFQNDVGSGNAAAAEQNMNDLLAAIGQPNITLTPDLGTYSNQQPVINTGTSGIANLCAISPVEYASGGLLSGPGMANAATVDIPAGTIAGFWQTPWGGILGLAGEFYTSGNWAGTCLPGSGQMVWGFMTTINPGCVTVLADFTMSSDTICVNAPLDLTDVSSADSIIAWDWIFTNGTPGTSNVQHPTGITYANAGIYDITLTVTDSSGTMDDTTMQVVVTNCSPPVASFSISSDTLCLGDSLVVNDLSTSISPITDWDWTFVGGNPATSNLQDPGIIDYANAGTYDVTLTVTNNFGSDDTTITIVVIDCSLPVAIFSIPNDTICHGDCFALTDLSTSAYPITNWDWTMVGANPASSTDQYPANVCYPNPGTYDIVLTVTDSLGVQDDTTLQIFVADCQPPIASFSIPDTICATSNFNPADLSTSNTPILAWDWVFTGANPASSNIQNPVVSYPTPGTYNITLTVTNIVGSDDTTLTIVVVDCQPPVANFTFPPDTLCPGDCLTFTDLSTSQEPITSWAWTFSVGTPASSDQQDPGVICFANSGVHPVTLTATSVNGSHDTTFYVVVQNPPQASFSINPYNPVIDETVTLLDQSTGAASIIWNVDGTPYTTPSVSQTYNESGTHEVVLIVTSSAGCTDTLVRTFTVVEDLIYYVPNAFTPDGDEFNQVFKPIFTSGFDPQDYTFEIFNRWGELIFISHDHEIGWDGTNPQGVMVQSGVYTWRIEFKTLLNDERKVITGHVNVLR